MDVDIPVDSPRHEGIGNDEWRKNIEDLVLGASPCVEDGGVKCSSEGTLSVGAEGVCSYALLCLGTWWAWDQQESFLSPLLLVFQAHVASFPFIHNI